MSFAAEQSARVLLNLATYNIEGVRPEDQHNNSLVNRLPKSAFEAVAYPDREGMMTTVGGGWCADVRNVGDGLVWFTSVKLRDIRSGSELASYNCALNDKWVYKLR
jgi:hypothetical protein